MCYRQKRTTKSILLVLSLVLFTATSVSAQAIKKPDALKSLLENDYKYFTGTIANMPVVVIIESINGVLSGHYYYEKYRQTIPLTNQPSGQENGIWQFVEAESGADSSKAYPVWECRLKNGELTGTWRSADRAKTYPIELKETYPFGVSKFGYRYFDNNYKAFPTWDSSPVAEVSCSFPVASDTGKSEAWLNKQIKLLLGFDSLLSFDAGREKWVQAYKNKYGKSLAGMDSSYFAAASSGWQSNHAVQIQYNGNGFVVLSGRFYDYTGGAHGNPAEINVCLDCRKQRVLRLSDVITIDSAKLQELIETRFRKDYGLLPGDSLTRLLFDNQLLPNKNFGFGASGIYFTYNPYEVAPYVVGIIDIFIPYNELKGLLKEDFKKRMNLDD